VIQFSINYPVESGVPKLFKATWMMESLRLFIQGKKALVIGEQAHPLKWISVNYFAQMVSKA